MTNLAPQLLANSYSSLAPLWNTAAVICRSGGVEVPCSSPLGVLGLSLGFGFGIFLLALGVLMIVSAWKVFAKAGKPGWAALIPIYNTVVMLEITRKPIWWVILTFIPLVNIIISFIIAYHMAKVFGKDIGFALGMIFLPFIFYPILAFGSATYRQITPMVTSS